MQHVQLKRLSKQSVVILLTLGSSLTLGLLSFGGFYAIYPSIALGLTSFALATLYEGEIYKSNISDALRKLTTRDYYKRDKAKALLLDLLSKTELTNLPLFFKDYYTELTVIAALKHLHSPTEAEKKALKAAKKSLKRMELFAAECLFNTEKIAKTPYAEALKTYFDCYEGIDALRQSTHTKTSWINTGFYFSALCGSLFGLGSIYLILESLATLSFLSLSFATIVALSALSGAAYTFLVYNSLSDMIWNESLVNWWKELKHDINNASFGKGLLLACTSLLLVSCAIALTIFTAGTWWTIAKNVENLPPVMKRFPRWITGIVIPAVTGIGALFFTLENTKGSMDTVKKLTEPSPKSLHEETADAHLKQRQTRPLYQRLNPFRWLVYLGETPLKVIGFMLHIVSIGVITDRIPGIPALVSAVMSMISEAFEDFHYFIGHDTCEGHKGHDHSHDLPSQIISLAFSPIRALGVVWDVVFSQFTAVPVNFTQAWQRTFHAHHDHAHEADTAGLTTTSAHWQQQSMLMTLSKGYHHLKGDSSSPLTQEKSEVFHAAMEAIRAVDCDAPDAKQTLVQTVQDTLQAPPRLPIDEIPAFPTNAVLLSQHRHRFHFNEPTRSQQYFNKVLEEYTSPEDLLTQTSSTGSEIVNTSCQGVYS